MPLLMPPLEAPGGAARRAATKASAGCLGMNQQRRGWASGAVHAPLGTGQEGAAVRVAGLSRQPEPPASTLCWSWEPAEHAPTQRF